MLAIANYGHFGKLKGNKGNTLKTSKNVLISVDIPVDSLEDVEELIEALGENQRAAKVTKSPTGYIVNVDMLLQAPEEVDYALDGGTFNSVRSYEFNLKTFKKAKGVTVNTTSVFKNPDGSMVS